jgi:DNA-binding transcriptional MocR family regulator
MNKYEEIAAAIESQIISEQIHPGEKVPSIRKLSAEHQCSHGTIIKALQLLESRHMIYSKPKSGYYVIESAESKSAKNSQLIQASTSFPDIQQFPYEDFQHCMIQAINSYKENLFSYTNPKGLPPMLQTMKTHLEDHQIFTNLDNLFITTGAQQAIDLLTKMPFPNGGDTILTEQPTYFGALKAFSLNNTPTIGITRDFTGIDLNDLESKFKNNRLKFFYTTPRLHNPVGYSYTRKEIDAILELAYKYNVYILEDDYMADFIDSNKLLPMYAYDKHDMVINIKSFSKILLPGLRLSSLVLPKVLIDTFSEYKKWADVNSTIISQGALEIFIRSGMYDAHRTKIKTLYSKRMSHLINCLDENIGDTLIYSKPLGGYFLTICAKTGTRYEKIMSSLEKHNIQLVDIRVCFLEEFRNSNYFRMSVSKMDEQAIDIAIPEIVRTIRQNTFKFNNR